MYTYLPKYYLYCKRYEKYLGRTATKTDGNMYLLPIYLFVFWWFEQKIVKLPFALSCMQQVSAEVGSLELWRGFCARRTNHSLH